jgi:preprotein translocase subunit SecD
VADARDRALEVIRNRVDSMGVAEPNIYPDGEKRIVVQIPGMKAEDRERASANIRKAAFLEFRMVHPKNDELVDNLFRDRKVPAGYEIVSLPGRQNGDFWVRKGPPPGEAERARCADSRQARLRPAAREGSHREARTISARTMSAARRN